MIINIMTKRAVLEETENSKQDEVISETNTVGKCNIGKWSDNEHENFLHAIKLYGNQWKKVRSCVKTRSCAQIRSHCQKYFRRKRNLLYQELRRTNKHKGMRFLVVKEYYNYAGTTNRHGESSNAFEMESVNEEEKKEENEESIEESIEEPLKEPELPSVQNFDLIKLEEPRDEPNDPLFGLDATENLVEETCNHIPNYFYSDFLLEGVGLYELDNDLLHNYFY
jgi:SHAQKYF class myb-like DNA-binding protein